jgi:hypothetical protein
LLIKWNSTQGDIIWNRTFSGLAADYGLSVWGYSNSDIITCGYTNSSGAGNMDFLLISWDPDTGAKHWNKTWGGTNDDYGYSIWCDSSGIYACGFTSSYGKGGSDLALVKWDAMTGDIFWYKTWGYGSNDYGYSVYGDNKGNVYTGGRNYQGYLAIVKWAQNFAPSIKVVPDQTYILGVSGHTLSWNITDSITSTRNYIIWRNGTEVNSGIWNSGVPVSINTDSLGLAKYNFTISAEDGMGGIAKDMVLISVIRDIVMCPDKNMTWGQTAFDDYGKDIWIDSDNNTYSYGQTRSYSVPFDSVIIIKRNKDGSILWNSTWTSTANLGADSGIWGNNAGDLYSIAKMSNSTWFLIRWNASNGQIIWNTPNYGAPLVGKIWGDNNSDIYTCKFMGTTSLMKFDGDTGASMWNMSYPVIPTNFAVRDLLGDDAGSIYMIGDDSILTGNCDLFIYRLDASDGHLIWERKFDTLPQKYAGSLWCDKFGSIYASG